MDFSSSSSFFVHTSEDLFDLGFEVGKAVEHIVCLRFVVRVVVQIVRQVRFEPTKGSVAEKVCDIHNLLLSGVELGWVKLEVQLDLGQERPKFSAFPMEEVWLSDLKAAFIHVVAS